MSEVSSVGGGQAGSFTISFNSGNNISPNKDSVQKMEQTLKKLEDLLKQLQQQQANQAGGSQGSQDPQGQMDDILKQIQQLTKDIQAAKVKQSKT